MFDFSLFHVYCRLLHGQNCCDMFVMEGADMIQESLHSKEYYQEEEIKSGK
jgi:hypothetical protein